MKKLFFPLLFISILSCVYSVARSGVQGLSGTSFVLDSTVTQQIASSIKSAIAVDLATISSRLDTLGATVTAQGANSKVPPGIIASFAGSGAMSGYLLCNGAAVAISSYPDLYAAIGISYNNKKDPTTGAAYASPASGFFRLPDYRGVFLRGIGTNNLGITTTLGDWQDDSTSKNSMLISSTTPSLSASMAAVGNHSHGGAVIGSQISVQIGGGNIGGAGAPLRGTLIADRASSTYGTTTVSGSDHTHSISADGAHTHTFSGTAAAPTISLGSSQNETRPQNVGIFYYIKY